MIEQALITIRDKQWQVNIAVQPWELIQGLAGLPYIPPATGMLFDVGQQQIITVTTLDMLFPIDIAFLSDSLVVTEVYRSVEPGYLITSDFPARYFLEVNAGELEEIEPGDRASLQILAMEQTEISEWISPIVSFAGCIMIMAFMTGIMREIISPKQEGKALQLPEIRQAQTTMFYWTAWNKDTGEIAENAHPFNSPEKALAEGKKFAGDNWYGEILIEVWQQPYKYSSGLNIKPVVFEKIESGKLSAVIPEQTPTHLLEKWSKAKVRNSALALKDLESLKDKYDISDCKEALLDYRAIAPLYYSDREEYQEARDEAWEEFLQCLEELVAEEEQLQLPQTKLPLQAKRDELEYLADSPEFLAYTIDDIGYREKIDNAFKAAIKRVRRQK